MNEVNRFVPLYSNTRVQIELSGVDPTYGRFSCGVSATMVTHDMETRSSTPTAQVVRITSWCIGYLAART